MNNRKILLNNISKNGINLSHATLKNSEGIPSIPGDILFFKYIIEARISEAVIGESKSFVVRSYFIMKSVIIV